MTTQELLHHIPHMRFKLEAEEHKEALNEIEDRLKKSGHWIRWYEVVERGTCTDHIPHCKCSECEINIDSYLSSFMNYCPNCGADMRGTENE